MPTIRCDMCGKETDDAEATQLDANAILWACPSCVPPGTMMMCCVRCQRYVNVPFDNWDQFQSGPVCDDCLEDEE